MPKIRKKTSKRGTTRLREKIKHKVSESHKKAKKAAKKDVTWKSNKSKDPGIPSLFPYKEELLAEAQAAKLRKEQEKQARKEAAMDTDDAPVSAIATLAESALSNEDDVQDEVESDEDEDANATSSSLKQHARSLRDVIERSDVIVQVLDARDPDGTRSRKIERQVVQKYGKKLVIVLNKIDLVPRENIESWLSHLRVSFPAIPFRSSTQSQRNNLSAGRLQNDAAASTAATSTQPLLTLLKSYSRNPAGVKAASTLVVGVIGFPNVGKSSLINTLKRSKACGVAPTPGFTKTVQQVALDGGLKILDCPGVVFEGGDNSPARALRNCVAVEQIQDPVGPVEVILQRCKKEHLMQVYNIPMFTTSAEFLIAVARGRGRLKKGGVPDLTGTARSVLRDWNAGRIPYYTVPPATPVAQPKTAGATTTSMLTDTTADVGSSTIVSELAPAFDLDALFGQADSQALEGLQSAKEMKGIVRAEIGEQIELDAEGVVAEDDDEEEFKLVGQKSAAQLAAEEEAQWEDESDEESDQDMGDSDSDVAPMLVPSLTKPKKRKSLALEEDEDMEAPLTKSKKIKPIPKAKSVKFADAPLGPTPSVDNEAAQKSKMFAVGEEPTTLNRDIKKQAKKEKKRKEKERRLGLTDLQGLTLAEPKPEKKKSEVPAEPTKAALKRRAKKAAAVAEKSGDVPMAAPKKASSTNKSNTYDFNEFFSKTVVVDGDEEL